MGSGRFFGFFHAHDITSKAVELIIAGDCAGSTPHSSGVGKGVFTMTIDQGEFEKISIRISLRCAAGA